MHTTEGDASDGAPIHQQIVRRLLASGIARGATAVRGVWGFRSEQKPPRRQLFSDRPEKVRSVGPVIVDTPAVRSRAATKSSTSSPPSTG